MADYVLLQNNLNYQFNNLDLLIEALTHPSSNYLRNRRNNYERLELLGDKILAFIIIEYLLQYYKNEDEGDLSKRLANLVSKDILAVIAQKLELGKYIIMSNGEEVNNGRENQNTLENTLEALIGAVYLDSDNCSNLIIIRNFILKHWGKHLNKKPFNPKSELQEWTQKHYLGLPEYKIKKIEGSAHNPTFTMALFIKNYEPISTTGSNKQLVEKKLASMMLEKLKEHYANS